MSARLPETGRRAFMTQKAKHRVKVRPLVFLTLGVKRAVRGGNAFKAFLAVGDFASNTLIKRVVFENEPVEALDESQEPEASPRGGEPGGGFIA